MCALPITLVLALPWLASVQVAQKTKDRLLKELTSEDSKLVLAARETLRWKEDPDLPSELITLFKSVPAERCYPAAEVLMHTGHPDLTPDLLRIMEKDADRALAAIHVLHKLGDARAEASLIALLESFDRKQLWIVLECLSTFGGPKSIEAIQRLRLKLDQKDVNRRLCLWALIRLRAPKVSDDILAEIGAMREELGAWKKSLARLGDRSILPELVKLIQDKDVTVDDRSDALEVLAALGSPEQVGLLATYLRDEYYSKEAAQALVGIGDPTAYAALVEAFNDPANRADLDAVTLALLRVAVPRGSLDSRLIEILEGSEPNKGRIETKLQLAARTGGPKLHDWFLDRITGAKKQPKGWSAAFWALLPLLKPEDRQTIEKARGAPDLAGRWGAEFAAASLGDRGAQKKLLDLIQQGFLKDGMTVWRDADLRDPLSPLELLPGPPEGWIDAVREAYPPKKNAFETALFLARHRKKEGVDLLKSTLREGRSWDAAKAASALVRLGEKPDLSDLVRQFRWWHPGEDVDRHIAERLDPKDLPDLRALARSAPERAAVSPARWLAIRGDVEMTRFFLLVVRQSHSANIGAGSLAEALAQMGRREAAHEFRRMLRADDPERRGAGARCLSILGDRSFAHEIAPLLDDLEFIDRNPQREAYPRFRVREEAVEAIERLSGQKFEGTRHERAAAARAWYDRERDSIK